MENVMSVRNIIFLFLSFFLLTACGDKIEPGHSASGSARLVRAAVAVAEVTRQPAIYDAVGTVVARTTSTLSGKLMGSVTAVNVREGDFVKAGDVLVVIDAQQVSAQLRQAKARLAQARDAERSSRSALDAAKAGADLARATYKRYQQLILEQSVSQQEFEEVEGRYRQSEAALAQADAMVGAAGQQVQQAQAALTGAGISKEDARILAPYDGQVTAKMISVGDLASPGTPFVTLEKSGVYCVDLVLPESHIQAVAVDQAVTVRIPALKQLEIKGVIGRIVPTADEKSRSFLVKVKLPENPSLRSGLFVRVAIELESIGRLLIPASAVILEGQLTGVYKVDDQQVARFRLIRIGEADNDRVAVISGVKAGDRFVVDPPPDMHDGVIVEPAS